MTNDTNNNDGNPHRNGCAWVEGEFVPIGEAKISLLDAGFTRSDVTYDVVAVWNGKFFRIDDHLDRFGRSLERLRLTPDLDREAMAAILHGCVGRSGLDNAYVEMVVTRGHSRPGGRDPWNFDNHFYAYAIPYVWIVDVGAQLKGSHLVIARDTVRIPEDSVDPTVKNFHWGDLTRGAFEARERGGTVSALPDQHGNLTEGPGFNVFTVVGDELRTPDRGVLHGITRRTVLELAQDQGLRTTVAPLPVADVALADEVFLTSTAGGVMPVTMVDGMTLGDGNPGGVTMALRQAYWDAHDDPRWATEVRFKP